MRKKAKINIDTMEKLKFNGGVWLLGGSSSVGGWRKMVEMKNNGERSSILI